MFNRVQGVLGKSRPPPSGSFDKITVVDENDQRFSAAQSQNDLFFHSRVNTTFEKFKVLIAIVSIYMLRADKELVYFVKKNIPLTLNFNVIKIRYNRSETEY